MTFAPETDVNIRQFPVRVQPEGVISIPSAVREKLNLTEGEILIFPKNRVSGSVQIATL